MIPLAVPHLVGNEARYLQECIESTFVSSVGLFVDRFEGMAAEASGAVGAVATSAGTTGLHAALLAVGVGRDDLVVLPSLTFVASANAVAHCGADPWLFDVEPGRWTLDPALVAAELKTRCERRDSQLYHRPTNRRVAAVVPVHVVGHPADMDALVETARQYDLPVVADAAAALGSRYKGRRIAEMGADLSVVSFNGNKTVTAGGGGVVVGNDPAVLKLVRHLTTTARAGEDYLHDRVGYNYRMTNLQAAVGCAQLEQLETFVAAKRGIRARYDAAFTGVAGLTPFPQPADSDSECWFSGFTVDSPPLPDVAELRARLRAAQVDARPFWMPMHLQPPFAHAPRTAMPVSDGLWRRILTLPCSTGLSAADQDRVIAALREALA
ncbi:Predicted pyridoxal phosphate-dependent enzyme [Candidatus Terasakiella magnetica]|nr:Predicted pyridoxal phosphate-dependent enzyme [Candidatus Terasakiella magnetica]